jgi:hypothetical protein
MPLSVWYRPLFSSGTAFSPRRSFSSIIGISPSSS